MSRHNRRKRASIRELPPIPDRRYFTISEVSFLCGVKAYVLRYWEQEFSMLKPLKRRGNRRYYRPTDILLVRQIRKLLYEDGFTIEGARAQLSQTAVSAGQPLKEQTPNAMIVKEIITDLESVLQHLRMQ